MLVSNFNINCDNDSVYRCANGVTLWIFVTTKSELMDANRKLLT